MVNKKVLCYNNHWNVTEIKDFERSFSVKLGFARFRLCRNAADHIGWQVQ